MNPQLDDSDSNKFTGLESGHIMQFILLGLMVGLSIGKKLPLESRFIESIAASTGLYALQMTKPRVGDANVVLGDGESDDVTKVDETFEKEKLAFYKLKPVLLQNKKYYGKHVAIVDGQLVDFDDDKTALIKRVYANKGYVVMYVGRIVEEETILEIPSPELV